MTQYTIRIMCDGCGRQIEQAGTNSYERLKTIRWDWQRHWHGKGILVREMFRRPTKHFCKACADGPKPPPASARDRQQSKP